MHPDHAPICLDGTKVALAPEGGPCGTFVERDGSPSIEIVERERMSPGIRE